MGVASAFVPWSVSMMVMKIPTWLAVASGLTLKVNLICLAFKDKKNRTSMTNLMGEDGVTDSTGESSRPLETWFEKGPNLTRVQNSRKKGAWVWAVLQN